MQKKYFFVPLKRYVVDLAIHLPCFLCLLIGGATNHSAIVVDNLLVPLLCDDVGDTTTARVDPMPSNDDAD